MAPAAGDRDTLAAHDLRKRLGGRWVVNGVSLTIGRHEIVGLLGPNGAGKTVTFYMISGLLRPDGGTIFLDGEDITGLAMHKRARRGIAYLPQERSVFHGLTAQQNIAAILETRGRSRRESRAQARKLLAEFGLERLAKSKARILSGGEQRRLEVARSMAIEPRFMLSDEPFAGIDPLTIEMLHRLFVDLRSRGMGILLTDHNVAEALTLCDRAYIIFNGEILAHGTPAELVANSEVREHFLGEGFDLFDAASTANPP